MNRQKKSHSEYNILLWSQMMNGLDMELIKRLTVTLNQCFISSYHNHVEHYTILCFFYFVTFHDLFTSHVFFYLFNQPLNILLWEKTCYLQDVACFIHKSAFSNLSLISLQGNIGSSAAFEFTCWMSEVHVARRSI